MVGRAFQVGLSFFSTMIVARYLGPKNYGTLGYVYSFISFFIPLCTLGFNDITIKEVVHNENESEEIIGTMVLSRITVSIVSIICSVLVVSIITNNKDYLPIALLQSLTLLFQSFESISFFYQAKKISAKVGIAYCIAYVVTFLFRLFAIATKSNIVLFAVAMSLDFGVFGILLLIMYRQNGYRLKFSINMLKQLLLKSRYYIFAGIMTVLYGKVIDVVLLGRIVDETSVGYYTAATTICNAWPFVLVAIIDSSSPIIIESFNNKEIFNKKLKQLYASIFYFCIVVCLLIGILSKVILTILYGTDYLDASLPLKIVSCSTAFSYIGVARTIWIQCENKTKYETIITAFGAIVSLVSNFVLIPLYGIIGAAVSLFLTQFLANFVLMFFIAELKDNGKLILDAILLKDVF